MEGVELELFEAWLCGSVVLPCMADEDMEGGRAAVEEFFW